MGKEEKKGEMEFEKKKKKRKGIQKRESCMAASWAVKW